MSAPVVAYIFIRYPVLSQRFLQREVAALKRLGLTVRIFSLFAVRGDADCFRWWEVFRLVLALPRELARDRALLRDGWRALRGRRHATWAGRFMTIWAAIFAVCRARQFREQGITVVHGAWATSPATAAAILGRLCGIPFSFGAHAYDIHRHGGDPFLGTKLKTAAMVHTTTQTNIAYLQSRAVEEKVWEAVSDRRSSPRIVLARRGLDHLPDIGKREREPGPLRILSVGRLVEKKGHEFQLAACSALKQRQVPFEARILGDGPLRGALQAKIDAAGLRDCVTLCGAMPHEDVDAAYRWADLFWHTGIVDRDGDRDGLPNVIPEALAHGLPVLTHHAPGPMEAITNEENGLVVDATDAAALADAVQRLAGDAALRQRLGSAGRRWVEQHFMIDPNAKLLADAFHALSR